jgi:S-adenosylmethionine hydrolase
MIFLLSDFGSAGPYPGLMELAVRTANPAASVVHLIHELPAFQPGPAGVLVAALGTSTPPGSVLVCVVDPGVGTSREPMVLAADRRWYVGPENGLFDVVIARSSRTKRWKVDWRPERLSATFHGRDLFAPLAARIAGGGRAWGYPQPDWSPPDHAGHYQEVIYIDPYGNAMTGLFAADLQSASHLIAGGQEFRPVRTFAEADPGEPVWLANSIGLAELCLNGDDCAARLGLSRGDAVTVATAG